MDLKRFKQLRKDIMSKLTGAPPPPPPPPKPESKMAQALTRAQVRPDATGTKNTQAAPTPPPPIDPLKQYWLHTFQWSGHSAETKTYDKHAADVMTEWNKVPANKGKPLVLIFSISISDQQAADIGQ